MLFVALPHIQKTSAALASPRSSATILSVALCLGSLGQVCMAAAPGPSMTGQWLQTMDQLLRGSSHEATLLVDVKRRGWQRHYTAKVWMKGLDYAFVRVLEPKRVAGQGFLRVKGKYWGYLPAAERVVRLPLSLLFEPFLGTDFSTDDIVKLTYLPRDYDSKLVGEEKVDGVEAYHLELTPHKAALVSYPHVEVWLREADSAPLRCAFYNNQRKPVKTLHFSKFAEIGSHSVPTVWRMENNLRPGRETTITIADSSFNVELPTSLFTRENLIEHPFQPLPTGNQLFAKKRFKKPDAAKRKPSVHGEVVPNDPE